MIRAAHIASAILAATLSAVPASAQLTSKPVTLQEIADESARSRRAQDAMFWNRSRGMKQFHERYAEGAKRIAIIQVSTRIQGDVHDVKEDVIFQQSSSHTNWATGIRTTMSTTEYQITPVPGYSIPAEYGLFIAADLAEALESQLKAKGFDVIPAPEVAATKAYQSYMAGMQNAVTVEDASSERKGFARVFPKWALFAPPGMLLRAQNTLTTGNGDWLPVSPDKASEYLKALQAELGQDVLFLQVTGMFPSSNLEREAKDAGRGRLDIDYTRSGVFGPSYQALIHDAEVKLPGMLKRFCCSLTVMGGNLAPEPRPEFVKGHNSGMLIDWRAFVRDAMRTNAFFAEAIATRMAEKRTTQ
jgi:hypothetical protein